MCKRCPLRLIEARDGDPREGPAALVEEILRGGGRPLPASVSEALAALAIARRQQTVSRP